MSEEECRQYVSNNNFLDEIRAIRGIRATDENFKFKMREALSGQLGSTICTNKRSLRAFRRRL